MSFNLIAAVIWVFVFKIQITFTTDTGYILSAAVMTALVLVLMLQVNYFIGILAFKFLDTGIFMMIKDNVLQFVTGSLIPLALLPSGIIKVMSIFPFYYVSYLPSMLLIGRNGEEFFTGLLMLITWNVLLGVITYVTYKKLRCRYDGVGI